MNAPFRPTRRVPLGNAVWLMPRADQPVLMHDVEEADAMSVELSDAGGRGLEAVWRYAAEIVCTMTYGRPRCWTGSSMADRGG